MAESAIVVELAEVKLVFGKDATVDILIDGKTAGSMKLGERRTFSCPSGEHEVRALLHAIFDRRSNTLRATVPDGGVANVQGTYSRLWGNLKLRSA